MLRKGDKIGEYILIKRLGQGGFGEVWKAEKRTELSTNEFAIKFFVPKDETKIDRDKIRKEIETWKILSGYSHIISVIEADIFEQYVYVVSELAEGGALDKYLIRNDGKAKNHAEAVKIASDILIGLEQMHGEGFVHRDLKPANVLIKKGLHCLADFGISREMKTSSKATGTSGTYEYMPPEAFAKNPSVTLHTDIWGVGVILQELLTGKLPFPLEDISSFMWVIKEEKPEEMSEEVPATLREVVNKALQKERDKRYQTAREMRVELEKALMKPPKETIIEEDFEQDLAKIRQAEADKVRYAQELKEAKAQSEKLQNELKAEKAKQAEIEKLKQVNVKAGEEERRQAAIKLEREKTEREILAEKERQRLAEEEKARQRKLEEARKEAEAHKQTQADLFQRARNANGKAGRLGVEKLGAEYLNEESVSRFEAYLAEIESQKPVPKPNPEPEPQPLFTSKTDSQDKKMYWVIGGVAALFLFFVLPLAMIAFYNQPTTITANTAANKSAPTTAANKAAPVSSNPATFKNSIGMEFVKIPAGSFQMGSPTSEKDRRDNETQHQVRISKEFYMGKYEVTQEEYEKVTGTNPSYFKNCARCPVEQVSWEDADKFIKALNAKGEGKYRLPSEAEWEYAARGGKEGEVFGIGDGKNLSSEEANFDGNYPYGNATKGKYLEKTVNVGSYKPNDFGLYDMHGNVWEWCNDWYGTYPSGSVTDPTGPASGSIRVNRGGSWFFDARNLRSALRSSNTPSLRDSILGFRLIRE